MWKHACEIKLTILLLCGAALLVSCSKDEVSPEAQIEQAITLAETAAEERSISSFSELIAPNYQDKNHKTRKALLQTVAYYFLRHQSIHLLVDIQEIKFVTDSNAEVDMFVGTAGNLAPANADAFLQADLLRVKASFRKIDSVWQVNSASWHHATPDEYRKALLP